ncbi:HD-GYP domain-containing protein [Sessilibacter corallicola]|uniref:HD-GYP domain-containing protein n=1 Tax=Sessilibacter corallicola TaxID=2904075 RepID=UPI001E49881C|nr:HD domain-containing phosphohydrolase [Sessilibacter corallicola]MCE2028809.1 HD domain-containing protein [Sessilibacter corallicola]
MLFSSPEFLEESSGMDLLENIDQFHTTCTQLLLHLEFSPNDKSALENLNQSVRQIKSLLLVERVNVLSPLIQSVEDLLEELSSNTLALTTALNDVLLLCLLLIRETVEKITFGKIEEHESQEIKDLCRHTTKIVTADEHQVTQQIENALSQLLLEHQTVPTQLLPTSATTTTLEKLPQWLTNFGIDHHDDLLLMLNLTPAVESRSPRWAGRTELITKLSLLMNQKANNPSDPNQLAMAAIAHDLGMTFIPLEILHKNQPFNDLDQCTMRDHLRLGAEPLKRLGWLEASEMVLQHHEYHDGSGYPVGLEESQICDGAKILAIADSYFACSVGNEYRQQRQRPQYRAIMEINRFSGTRFSPFWVKMFNQVTTQ